MTDLLATVYLDGREQPEKKMVIVTDRRVAGFSFPHGQIWMSRTTRQDSAGKLVNFPWTFRPLDAEILVSSLESMNLPAEDTAAARKSANDGSRPGVIKLVFERIKILRTSLPGPDVQEQDLKIKDLENKSLEGISHTVAYGEGAPQEAGIERDRTGFEYLDDEGCHYATFKFYYSSEEIMRKFEIPGYRPAGNRNGMFENLSFR